MYISFEVCLYGEVWLGLHAICKLYRTSFFIVLQFAALSSSLQGPCGNLKKIMITYYIWFQLV